MRMPISRVRCARNVRNHAVDPHDAEEQRDARGNRQHHHGKGGLRHGMRPNVIERLHGGERQIRIDGPDGLLELAQEARRAYAIRSHGVGHRSPLDRCHSASASTRSPSPDDSVHRHAHCRPRRRFPAMDSCRLPRTRLPIALDGSCQYSRARVSEITMTGRRS